MQQTTNLGAHKVGMSVFLELQDLHTLSRAVVVPTDDLHTSRFKGGGDRRIHLIAVPVSLVYLARSTKSEQHHCSELGHFWY